VNALTVLDELFDRYSLPLGRRVDDAVDWANTELGWVWAAIRWPIEQMLDAVEGILLWLPWYVVVLAIGFLAWRMKSWKAALLYMALMVFLGFLSPDIWRFAMTTLGMIVTAVIICAVVGIPLGIWAASNDRVYAAVRPVLDAMQTIHPFIYLIPVVILFGIGQLLVPPDQRSRPQGSPGRHCGQLDHPPHRHRPGLALGLDGLDLLVNHRVAGGQIGLLAHVDAVRGSGTHQPRGGVDSVAHGRVVLALLRAHGPGHDLAGVDADVQPQRLGTGP
jgi:hypothetical protein